MSSSTLSLLNMPSLVLENIVSKAGVESSVILRKVCSSLRDFVDTFKIRVQLTELSIKVDPTGLTFILESPVDWMILYLVKQGNDMKILSRSFENSLVRNENCTDFLIGKFDFLLRNRKFPIGKLKLEFEDNSLKAEYSNLLSKLKEYLKSRRNLLQVEDLYMYGDEHEMLQVLPFLDPSSLKRIGVNGIGLQTDQLMLLDQWKAVKEIKSVRIKSHVPIKAFGHFETVRIYVNDISAQNIVDMKMHYVQSPNFKKVQVRIEWGREEMKLERHFGEPSKTRYGEEWYFRTTDPNFALHFLFDLTEFTFSRIPMSEVPVIF